MEYYFEYENEMYDKYSPKKNSIKLNKSQYSLTEVNNCFNS
jgi:hypothetical protein